MKRRTIFRQDFGQVVKIDLVALGVGLDQIDVEVTLGEEVILCEPLSRWLEKANALALEQP